MEKIIFILTFALITVSCQEQETLRKCHESCFNMTISNALPVQFWLNGEESYNNKSVCGVTSVCFCQPFQCDDNLAIQFRDLVDDDYHLQILNDSDEEIELIPFDKTVFQTSDFLESYPLDQWENGSGSPLWTTGIEPEVVTAGVGSTAPLLKSISGTPAGIYTLYYSINFSGSGVSASLVFRKSGVTVGTSGSLDNTTTGQVSVTLSDAPDEVRISVLSVTPSVRTTTLFGFELTRDEYIFNAAFTPNDYSICDQEIKLRILDTSSSPNTVVAYSDCLSIRQSHICTIPIDYSNSKNFNNITYADVSPTPVFRLRIPAIFFEEDNPAEQEDAELSNGEIVRLYNKIEKRKKLDIGFLPPYMHEKVQLVLMHDFIEIDDREWIRREAYEKTEGNKRYPLKRASVFLHDKNFIKENQL